MCYVWQYQSQQKHYYVKRRSITDVRLEYRLSWVKLKTINWQNYDPRFSHEYHTKWLCLKPLLIVAVTFYEIRGFSWLRISLCTKIENNRKPCHSALSPCYAVGVRTLHSPIYLNKNSTSIFNIFELFFCFLRKCKQKRREKTLIRAFHIEKSKSALCTHFRLIWDINFV